MSLLEINRSATYVLPFGDESTAKQVDKYAAFIHTSADDVVDNALNYVFSKDHDFQDLLKTPQAKQEDPAKKLAGVEGMIPHSIGWWCENGASHRKNFDTPPLEGICRVTASKPRH